MNTIGRIFRLSIYGESHGKSVGILIDGVPTGISCKNNDFVEDLSRRMPNTKGTTSRKDSLLPIIHSGVYNEKTTGSPILLEFENTDVRSKDYKNLSNKPRPGHSDFVAHKKYNGLNNPNGGGHFSGRLTTGLVAAGVIAKKILKNIEIIAKLESVHGSTYIDNEIQTAMRNKDSVGGIIKCTVSGLDIGFGEPFFDSIESCISHLVFSIPGVKGIEFGSGFDSANKYGSENNDIILNSEGNTNTNNAGGINGGISNGNDIVFKVAVKPTSSIAQSQDTIDLSTGEKTQIEVKGRHDACIALRVPVIIEAVAAIALADLYLIRQSQLI